MNAQNGQKVLLQVSFLAFPNMGESITTLPKELMEIPTLISLCFALGSLCHCQADISLVSLLSLTERLDEKAIPSKVFTLARLNNVTWDSD